MIQPAMPVTVLLPLVPPMAMPVWRGVEQRGEQFRPAHPRAAQSLGAHHFGHGILDGGRGDQRLLG